MPKSPKPQFSDEFIEEWDRGHRHIGYGINVFMALALLGAGLVLFT